MATRTTATPDLLARRAKSLAMRLVTQVRPARTAKGTGTATATRFKPEVQ